MELGGGDEAILVLIVELERVRSSEALPSSKLEQQKAANSVREMKPLWLESSSSMTRQSSSSSEKEEPRELKMASSSVTEI